MNVLQAFIAPQAISHLFWNMTSSIIHNLLLYILYLFIWNSYDVWIHLIVAWRKVIANLVDLMEKKADHVKALAYTYL